MELWKGQDMSTEEKKPKRSLDDMINRKALNKVINQSFRYQEKMTEKRNEDMINNMIKWNQENLSPNGGKKAFVRTQKEQITPKRRGGWLSKDDE